MTVQFTTDLPDVDSLPLDASVEDELTAEPSASPSLNHGEFEVEYREDGASTWTNWGTIPHDYSSGATIMGLKDGEAYDVRIRSQTVDITGTYVQESAITPFPIPGTPTYPATSDTSVDVAWTDNADNEIEQRVQRQRTDYEMNFETIATVAPDVESYTDDTVAPGREYQYRIQTATDHATATSSASTTTTTDLGLPKTQTRRQEWTVEVVTPTGEVLRPSVVGQPQWQPETTAMPRLRVPVPDRPRWHRDDLLESDATEVRCWYRGRQLPVDSIIRVEDGPGQVVLECRGASQLDTFIASEQIDEQETHLALRDLIDEHTDYAHDIDSPESDTRSDVEMLPASGPGEIRDAIDVEFDGVNPADANLPLSCQLGNDHNALELEQTCFLLEAEEADFLGTRYFGDEDPDYAGGWSGDQAVRLQTIGDYVEGETDFNHTIPSGECHVEFLFAVAGGGNPGFDIIIDNTVEESVPAGTLNQDADEYDTDYSFASATASSSTFGDVNPRIEVTESGSGSLYVDVCVVYDDRFDHSNNLDQSPTDGVLDGPGLYPQSYTIKTIGTASVQQVLGGRFDVSINDTSGGQGLGLSNDQGQTWKRGDNTASFEATFDSAENQIRGELRLGRWGTQDQSPAQGHRTQYIDSFFIYGNLDDTPVLLDFHESGDLEDILASAADSGDFVLEPRRDPSSAWDDPDGIVIEGCVAGQRTRDRIPEDLVDFSTARAVEDSYDRIRVKGASQRIEGEQFSASGYSNVNGLDEGPVVPASETVYDPSDGTEFEGGTDYSMDWELERGIASNGGIELLSGGSMSLDTTYAIDYRYKFLGEESTPNVSNPRTQEVNIANGASDRECSQLALALLTRVQQPLETATVTVQTDDPTVSLVDALSHPDLPLEGPLVIRDASFEPGEVRYTLGTRQSFDDVLKEIKSQYEALAEMS